MSAFSQPVLSMIRVCTRIFGGFIAVLLLWATSAAQKPDLEANRALWLTRADAITHRVVDKGVSSDDLEKAVVLSQLAELWWPVDRTRANTFLEKSVDTLFFYSTDEIKKNPSAFRPATQKVLIVVSLRDRKQTDRLVSVLTDAEKGLPQKDGFNADTLIDLALTLVKSDPRRATEIGILSFRFGQPSKFFGLYWELRKVSDQFADKFLQTAMLSAQNSPNAQIASNLKAAVFPEAGLPNVPESVRSSDLQKVAILKILADYVVQQRDKFVSKLINSCSNEASVIAPLRPQYAALLPDRVTAIEQSISLCVPNRPDRSPMNSDDPSSQTTEYTIEALLKLADEAKDNVDRRAYYLFRAASLANDKEFYSVATDILDNMSPDERITDKEFWETLRYTVASGLAFLQVNEGNLSEAMSTLDKVPINTRPFAKVGMALKCSPKDQRIREFCLSTVDGAMKEFALSDKSPSEKYGFWLKTVKLYSDYGQHLNADSALEAIAKGINKDFSDKKLRSYHINSQTIVSVVSGELLELYDRSLINSADLIADPATRTNVHLGLLTIALNQAKKLDQKLK